MTTITINGKTYEYGKRYYSSDLIASWVSTDRDGAEATSRLLPDNQPGCEYTEMGEIDGHKAIMSYIVSNEALEACGDDLGNIDWDDCMDSVMFVD